MKTFLIFIFFLLLAITARAQYYNIGSESATIKWRQIKTDKFTIIYPQEIDSIAQRYAWLFEQSYESVAAPLRANLSKTPIVLHPYNVNSNGLVVWAPRRMELMTIPPTNSTTQMWDKQLVLHETRHVAQMNKMGEGFFKYLHYFLGEQSESIAAGVYLYAWFLEGDATVSETAASNFGRGRQPEFLMPVKAFLLNNYNFSWDTWLNESYRYNIPNQYQLGYLLSSYAYKEGGSEIFGHMLEYTTHNPLKIPPPSHGLKKFGGFDSNELYEQAFAYMKEFWSREDSAKTISSDLQQLSFPEKERYRSYRSVVAVDTQTVIALRSDFDKARRLVSVDKSGNETLLKYVGQINSTIKRQNNFLYWTATLPHTRWEQVSYSIIQRYDLTTQNIQNKTSRTRYFAPAPSPDNRWVAVVENTPDGENFLVLLDAQNYKPQQRIASPHGSVLKEITWEENSERIWCSAVSDNGMAIVEYNLSTKKWSTLLPSGKSGINRLTTYRDYIIFESGYDGTNNIYALNIVSQKVYPISNVRFGAFDPSISADSCRLLFSNYTATGYTIASLPLNEGAWNETSFENEYRFEFVDTLSALAKFNIDTLDVPEYPNYKSKRYNRFINAFKIHSWAPFYYNPDELMSLSLDKDMFEHFGLGATVLSQNTLSTLTTRAAYRYKNGFHSGHFKITYRGLYPVIDASFDINNRHGTKMIRDSVAETKTPFIQTTVRMYLPLRFTLGAWLTGLTPQISYNFTTDRYYSYSHAEYQFDQYANASIYFYQQLPMAVRDIYPRWGYAVRLQSSFPIFSDNIYPIFSAQASCYLPGLFANHGIILTGGYQQTTRQNELRYMNFSHLRFPRGYTTYTSKSLANATFDYAFPLWYPDLNLSWLVYIKRIRMNLFSDYTYVDYGGNTSAFTDNLVSVGADLIFDFHALRFGFPINLGVRYAQPLQKPLTGNSLNPSFSVLFNITI